MRLMQIPSTARADLLSRIRRVKCDETKPHCNRCIKFGRQCDGYGEHEVPKNSQAVVTRIASFRPLAPLLQHLQPSPTLSKGPEEHQYFRYFRESTAPILSGGFDDPLWNRIILQTSYAEPAIHKMVISIGAMSRASALAGKESIANHRKYAFLEYGKALKGVRQIVKSNTPDSTRNVLVASLLIYCFEALHGNTETSIQYLKSALAVSLRNRHGAGPLMYKHFESSSPSQDIEADLITAFARLDGNLANRLESHDPSLGTVLGIQLDYYNENYTIPARFIDPETARRYLEHIQYRSRPNVSHQTLVPQSPQSGTDLEELAAERKITNADIDLLKSQLRDWFRAFQPLFAFSQTPAGSKDFQAVTTLRLQALACSLLLETSLGLISETASPAPPSEVVAGICAESVRWGRKLVEDKRFLRGFMFDLGIIPSLLVVVIATPQRGIGREVVDILRMASPRREATWDAMQTALMADGILGARFPEMEHTGVEMEEIAQVTEAPAERLTEDLRVLERCTKQSRNWNKRAKCE